jgi:K(+)-stimulated pyrophosphate-energized sodium pump
VELGVYLVAGGNSTLSKVLAVVFFLVAMFFIHRSFYGMRIETLEQAPATGRAVPLKA